MAFNESSFSAEVKDNEVLITAQSSKDATRSKVIARLVEAGFKPFGTVEQELKKAESSFYPDEGKIVELPVESGYYVTIVSDYWDVYYWNFYDSHDRAKESAIEFLSWSQIGAIVYITQNLNCYAKTFSVNPIAEIADGEKMREIRGY